jgi:hypothetical protein
MATAPAPALVPVTIPHEAKPPVQTTIAEKIGAEGIEAFRSGNFEGAREAYTHWPAYRISQGELRTFEWRLQDCYRQQRFPQLKFASEVAVGLSLFLAKTAEGGAMAAPAIRR